EGKTTLAEGWRGAREAVLVLQRCWTGPREPAEAQRRGRKRGEEGHRPPGPASVTLAGQEGQARVAIRLILHPTDFSERSEFAFGRAGGLARDHDSRLILLHVARPPVIVPDGGSVSRADDYPDRLKEELHQLLVPDPNVPVEYRLAEGEPVSEILAVATQA